MASLPGRNPSQDGSRAQDALLGQLEGADLWEDTGITAVNATSENNR